MMAQVGGRDWLSEQMSANNGAKDFATFVPLAQGPCESEQQR